MNSAERIFTSIPFLEFIGTLIVMGLLYLIARLISARMGVNDLLRTADRRIAVLKRVVRKVRVLCTEPSAREDLATGVRLLKEVIKWQKKSSRIMAAYLFDDREDKDVAAAKAIIDGVPNVCREAIVNVAEQGDTNLHDKFDNLDKEMDRASALLLKAKKLDKKKELLQL
jgi:hypothetical protein